MTYKYYQLLRNDDGSVSVHDPRYPNAPAVYRAASLDKAKQFVTAYRNGVTWASQAANV